MLRRFLLHAPLLFSGALACATAAAGQVSNQPILGTSQGKLMHASGTFEVKVKPAEPSEIAKVADTGQMTIDKTWIGAVTGSSKGEMLTGITQGNGSMAYVAMERFTGSVDGREGTLLFHHYAVMLNGKALPGHPDIQVVPDSGTGALQGISGRLEIVIAGGVHRYDFAYTLPGQQ